jgi:flagella basal body P-ring formation protein FlgA
MMRLFLNALFILCLMTVPAYAANVINIDRECILVEDIFPGIGIKDQVLCGLDYGETKKVSVQLATHIIGKYNIKASPGEAYFHRKGKKISQSDLEAKLYEALAVFYPNAELQIDKIRIQGDIYTAEDGKFSVEITNPRIGGMYGKLNNGNKDIGFTLYVKGFMDAYVTTDRIRKGDTLDKNLRKELSRLRGEPILDTTGYVASRNLGAGVPLTTETVVEQPELPEGAAVKIIYIGNGFRLEARGILQEDARTGSIVKIKNTDSGKIVTGKYQGDRIAIVNF